MSERRDDIGQRRRAVHDQTHVRVMRSSAVTTATGGSPIQLRIKWVTVEVTPTCAMGRGLWRGSGTAQARFRGCVVAWLVLRRPGWG